MGSDALDETLDRGLLLHKQFPSPLGPIVANWSLCCGRTAEKKRTLVDGGDWSCALFVPHILISSISIYCSLGRSLEPDSPRKIFDFSAFLFLSFPLDDLRSLSS